MWETWVRSPGREDPLEKEMATHSSILAWRIPWSLVGYSPRGRKESDTTERLHYTSLRTLQGISRDGGAMCKGDVQGDLQQREPRTKLATSEEDAIGLFIINMALEFLFPPWDVVISIRDGRPGAQERRRHPGVGEVSQHKHRVEPAPWVLQIGKAVCAPGWGELGAASRILCQGSQTKIEFQLYFQEI